MKQVDPEIKEIIQKLQKENEQLKKTQRKYKLVLGELIDRLAIVQLKQFMITDHKDEYAAEIKDILHDINCEINEHALTLDADAVRNIIINSLVNREIWLNEANFRKGIKEGNNLELSHSLNFVRCAAKNKIQEKIGGRKDYKLDVPQPDFHWIPSDWN